MRAEERRENNSRLCNIFAFLTSTHLQRIRRTIFQATTMKLIIAIMMATSLLSSISFAQSKQVREALRYASNGNLEAAKGILTELQEGGKEDAAIFYLQAVLEENADRAAFVYRKVLTEYPKSEWCDDSYWRLVQYYAVKGDTTKARAEFAAFKKKYPGSELLTPAGDLVDMAVKYMKTKATKPSSAQPAKLELNPNRAKAVAAFNKKPEAERKAITGKSGKKWGLQVGIFSTVEAAKAEAARFTELRLKNEIIEKDVNGKKMFAVIVGNYATKETAESNKSIVEKACECETIIYEKAK